MEIDLFRLIRVFVTKSWAILLAGVLGAAIALAGTFFLVTPQYESSVMLYVNNTLYADNLAESFTVIIKMRESLLDVIKYTKTGYTHKELEKMVTVSSVNNTDFFRVTVAAPDPYEAEIIANAIGEILPEKIAQIMDGITAKTVDEAVLAAEPSSPNYPNNALLGGIIGIMLAAGVVLLQELIPEIKRFYNKCWGQVMSLPPKS